MEESNTRKNSTPRDHPISRVVWHDRNELKPNHYNPNRVAPPELELLKISILEDGWTQPIVINDAYQIVDGFHRWTIAADPEVAALTGGKVPCVMVVIKNGEHQQMSTIRHNRARGTHGILPMGSIVKDLVSSGMSEEEICDRLKMEREEVRRLLFTQGVTGRVNGSNFSKAWITGERNKL